MIVQSLFNPVPIHSGSIGKKWYDNRKTYAGTHSHIYVPKGNILPFQITCGKNDVGIRVEASSSGDENEDVQGLYVKSSTEQGIVGTYTMAGNSKKRMSISKSGAANSYQIRFVKSDDYSYYLWHFLSRDIVTKDIPLSVLESGGKLYMGSQTDVETDADSVVVNVAQFSIQIVNCKTNVVSDITEQLIKENQLITVPEPYQTDERYYTAMFGGIKLSGDWSDGTHYLLLKLGNTEYYSEPFLWVDDLTGLIKITYRRSTPIITRNDYIPFKRLVDGIETDARFELYVMADLVTPPFYYEEEVDDMDGYKSVSKRVSYKNHKFNIFKCTEYFAEALRLMWHCDVVTVSDTAGTFYHRPDYVDAPQPEWSETAHFCSISLEYHTDTIMQTNGEITMIIDGNDFNNDYNSAYSNEQ